jgi:hypothetical protein
MNNMNLGGIFENKQEVLSSHGEMMIERQDSFNNYDKINQELRSNLEQSPFQTLDGFQ